MPLFTSKRTGETFTVKDVNESLSKRETIENDIEYRGAMPLGYLALALVPSVLKTPSWYVPLEDDPASKESYIIGRYRPRTKRFEFLYRAHPRRDSVNAHMYVVTSFETDGDTLKNRTTKWFRDPDFVPKPEPRTGLLGAVRGFFAGDLDWRPALNAAVAQLPAGR